jgi:His-Xaa-Ser system protein HxsD
MMGGIQIDNKKGIAVFSLNPKLYAVDVIHSAAYIMMDEAFIVLDIDEKGKIVVELRKKQKSQNLKNLVNEFYEEMYNYSSYKTHSEMNKTIREMILKRAIFDSLPKKNAKTKKKKN